jgi:hypothetical protein
MDKQEMLAILNRMGELRPVGRGFLLFISTPFPEGVLKT